ncbi:MAG: serine/threonine-protein kinase [Planctomycetota bacterium]
MTPELWQRVKQVFAQARSLSGAARKQLLDEQCADDFGLRHEVESLLSELDRGSNVLESVPFPADAILLAPAALELPVGERLGPYTVAKLIGAGSMGMVYLAEQDQPRRLVALKVLTCLSPSAWRRFEYEEQILARLEHPGIARIIEARVVATSRGPLSFYAMEFIAGLPLDQHVRAHDVDHRRRLMLFLQICDAVAHAHRSGVIHRDLKPANILVNDADQVKVLDFGVARLVESDQVTTLGTLPGSLIGTLSYMSPEQVRGDLAHVDTRSDVYALGVILCELLTQQLPYAFPSSAIADAARVICEHEPVRAGKVDARLRGDLEAILGKALAKDPACRYQSVAELADDLERHLRHEPVRARAPSTLYRVGRFVRRHRVLVGGITGTALALVIGLAAALWQARVATSERNLARAAERRERTAAAKATRVRTFLADMLASVDPEQALGRDTTLLRKMLDEAARKAQQGIGDAPEVEAEIRFVIGRTYAGLGLFEDAAAHLETALTLRRALDPPQPLAVADALDFLGLVSRERGDDEHAIPLAREAVAIRRQLQPRHSDLARSLHWLSVHLLLARDRLGPNPGGVVEVKSLLCEALVLRDQLEPRHVAPVLIGLARAHLAEGDLSSARARAEEALRLAQALGEQGVLMIPPIRYELGMVATHEGRLEDAEALLTQALSDQRKLIGENHPHCAGTARALAEVRFRRGDAAEAEKLAREALAIDRRNVDASLFVGDDLMQLARVFIGTGRWTEAEMALRDLLSILAMRVPRSHIAWQRAVRLMIQVLPRRASMLGDGGDPSSAERLLREAVGLARDCPSADQVMLVAESNRALGACLMALERYDEAEPLLLECYDAISAAAGDHRQAQRTTIENLVELYRRWEDPERAEEWGARLTHQE